jgi:multisubunit Na+/H+ antiporter MnhF subunit
MEQLFGFIVLLIIVNVFAFFRFVISSNFNKRIVLFSLVSFNGILCIGYWIYQVGFDNFNDITLITITFIVLVIMFVGFYKLNKRE